MIVFSVRQGIVTAEELPHKTFTDIYNFTVSCVVFLIMLVVGFKGTENWP